MANGQTSIFNKGTQLSGALNTDAPPPPEEAPELNVNYRPTMFQSTEGGTGIDPNQFSWNPYGLQQLPVYDSPYLNDDGSLGAEFTIGSSFDSTNYDKLADFAYSTDASPWLNLMNEQIASRGATARDDITAQRLGQTTQARENLAMRGGLRGGAGERLEQFGIQQAMIENQRLGRSMNDQLLEAAINEEAAKLDIRKQLPGIDLNIAGYETGLDKTNLGVLMDESRFGYTQELDRIQKENEILASIELAKLQFQNA